MNSFYVVRSNTTIEKHFVVSLGSFHNQWCPPALFNINRGLQLVKIMRYVFLVHFLHSHHRVVKHVIMIVKHILTYTCVER